jgi:hypothetical protein
MMRQHTSFFAGFQIKYLGCVERLTKHASGKQSPTVSAIKHIEHQDRHKELGII